MKNEAGEARERVIRMTNGKVDFGRLGWIDEEKTVALGEKIEQLELAPSNQTSLCFRPVPVSLHCMTHVGGLYVFDGLCALLCPGNLRSPGIKYEAAGPRPRSLSVGTVALWLKPWNCLFTQQTAHAQWARL